MFSDPTLWITVATVATLLLARFAYKVFKAGLKWAAVGSAGISAVFFSPAKIVESPQIMQQWLATGFPVPHPRFEGHTGEALVDVVMEPAFTKLFLLHLFAGIVLLVILYGVMEMWYPLGFLWGPFSVLGFAGLEYYTLATSDVAATLHELVMWMFAAGVGFGIGMVVAVLVAEPVFEKSPVRKQSQQSTEVDLENIEL